MDDEESFNSTRTVELVVDEEESGAEYGGTAPRLDQYLAHHLKDASRQRVKKLIDEGDVLVDGKRGKASTRLKGGETISITIPEPEPLDLVAEDLPVELVFEDEWLAVVNKPSGMVTHPGAGITKGTLVNALLHKIGESLSGISGTLRPGIVHRLDKDTSGLLVVAKNEAAVHHLQGEIKSRKAKRIYYALLEGGPSENAGTVSQPIGRHPVRRKEMAIVDNGRPATTHYHVLERFHKFSLVKLSLETGRTHQIRVHMAYLGCPVAGDIVYNRKTSGTLKARQKLGLRGHALHAAQLCFTHPESGVLLEFEAPLPDDFEAAVNNLRRGC